MSALRGDIGKLRELERSIRELPRVVGAEVAAAAASKITELARETFNASENAYGDSWQPGIDGRKVTLRKSGAIATGVRFVAIGTRLRAQLGPRYAKYQVGRRPIFPRSKLPTKYVEGIGEVASVVIRAQLSRGV